MDFEKKLNELNDEELRKAAGGMTEEELGPYILKCQAIAHLINARNAASFANLENWIKKIDTLIEKCENGQFSEVHSIISGYFSGVIDSTYNDMYTYLDNARKFIENNGLLNA